MKHISQCTFVGMGVSGQFRLPVTMHRTYCHSVVNASEIDNENPSCDDCIDNKVWEEIDARVEAEA